jgi:hypothetical protein
MLTTANNMPNEINAEPAATTTTTEPAMMAQRSRVPRKYVSPERRTVRFNLARPGGAKAQDMTVLNYRMNPLQCGVVDALAGRCASTADAGPDGDVLTISLVCPYYSTSEMESEHTYMHELANHLMARNAELMEENPNATQPVLYNLVGLRGLDDQGLKEVLSDPNFEFIGHKAPFVKTASIMGANFKLSPSLLAPPMEGFGGQKSARYARKSELAEIYADWIANGFRPQSDEQVQAALLRGGGRANRKTVVARHALTNTAPAEPAPDEPPIIKRVESMNIDIPISPARAATINPAGNDNLAELD